MQAAGSVPVDLCGKISPVAASFWSMPPARICNFVHRLGQTVVSSVPIGAIKGTLTGIFLSNTHLHGRPLFWPSLVLIRIRNNPLSQTL
jgi:hypothetical protein